MSSHRFCFALLAVFTVVAVVSLLAAGSLFAGVVGSPHDFSGTSLLSQYWSSPLTPAGVCSICHIPHNAQYGALWPRNLLSTYDNALKMNGGSGTSSDLPNYKRAITVQCYDCHDYHAPSGGGVTPIDTVPPYNGFATNHKPQNIAFGYQKTATGPDSGSTMKEDPPGGTEAGYYENNPPYLPNPQTYYGANSAPGSPFQRNLLANDNVTLGRSGGHYFKSANPNAGAGIYKGDKLPCSDCHDPHAWNPAVGNRDWHAFFRPPKVFTLPRWSTVFGSSNPIASTYMANPADLSGEASRNDALSRRLCIVCHATSGDPSNAVTFNDINSAYSSYAQVVQLPASIGEHSSSSNVACVSCHSHNAIGANCAQCHGFPPSSTATPAYPVTATSRFVPSPPPAQEDSHAKHYGGRSGEARNSLPGYVYRFDCAVCHYGSALGVDSSLQHHQNSRVSVVIQGAWTKAPNGSGPFGTYDNTNYYNQAFGSPPSNTNTGQLDNTTNPTGWGTTTGPRYGSNTCWNVYCHSLGRSQASMTVNDNTHYRQVAWNVGPQHCNDCHGRGTDNVAGGGINWGMPDYAGGAAGSGTANSHAAHVVTNRYECSVCHAQTVTGTLAGRAILAGTPTRHVNGIRDVAFDGVNATGTYDNTVGLKTCVVSCHGNIPLSWGGPKQSCDTCHVRAGDVDDFGTGTQLTMSHNGITAGIDNNEWNWSGHGKDAGQYDVSLNPAANLRGGGGAGTNKCAYCHDPAIPHDNVDNPFRLANFNIFTQGWNGACYVCHAAASVGNSAPGYAPAADNTGTYVAKTATSKVASNHFNFGTTSNARHSATYNGGLFCFDCHDPHGDRTSAGAGNIFMVGKRVSMKTDNAVGTGIPVGGNDNSNRPTATFTNNVFGSDYASTDGNAPFDGICETCHQAASGILHYTNTGRLDNTHFTTKCITCHTHDGGFRGLGGPDVGQYFDRPQAPGPSNFADNSSHPLRGLTTSDNTLLFGGQNCLGCHYSSGPPKTGDECLKCHFEAQPNAPALNHMDKALQLATVNGNNLPTTQFTIGTIQNYDDWCLLCHNGASVSLGGVTPSGRTVLSPSAFAAGRHRAQSPPVGCIYCHAPHGSGNARLVRINPANRASAGATPREFGVFPGDNTGSYTGNYQATPNEVRPYRARVDNNAATGNVYADADDETAFCNKACHLAKVVPSQSKDKIVKRDGTTGLYTLTPVNMKTYTIEGFDYTRDNVTNRTSAHGHLNNEIISTDDMVNWFADPARGNVSGPSHYKYPNSGNANPATFSNATSPLPFFPDFGPDGTRDFTNGYLTLGLIRYRYTCSTCHNPHGTTDTLNNVPNGESYPDLRGKRTNTSTLCKECHK